MKRNNVVNRLSARPRMNARSSGDGESWHVRVIMFLSDAEKFVGRPRPVGRCERWEKLGGYVCQENDRRRCGGCAERLDWESAILRLVTKETDFAFYAYSGGPGRPFAHEPSVYIKRDGILCVSQHGGLDI